jgi:phosphoenolpyruvate mutase
MPSVYISFTVDFIHHGHINIISVGRTYGDITVGLLTDEAIGNNKKLPYLNWNQRKDIIMNINGISDVIEQNEWDDSVNISKLRPDFVIHGDDWCVGKDFQIRKSVISILNSYGGKLIEVPYTSGISSNIITQDIIGSDVSPTMRLNSLKRLLASKKLLRFIEAHSPISALIAQSVSIEVNGNVRSFDGFWSSSLTDSTVRGKPDIEALDMSERLKNINDIFDVTYKPLIIDADTGGISDHFSMNIKSMERLGISAVIIEDKTGLKKNSLFGNDVKQTQEDVSIFSDKISIARKALNNPNFMIIARIESLILEMGMEDAISRALSYIEAGAHGIMIHSRQKDPSEVIEFANKFRRYHPNIPLVCVPTTYNSTKEYDLEIAGFNIVIYANHLLRASYPAMKKVAENILLNERSSDVDNDLISVNTLLELIPGTK